MSISNVMVEGTVAATSNSAENGYRLSWVYGWRLELLSDGRNDFFPQREDLPLPREAPYPGPLVLIGEEGGGETSFANWLGRAPSSPRPITVDLAGFQGTDPRHLAKHFLARMGVSGEDQDGYQALFNGLDGLKKANTLVVGAGIDRLAPALGGDFLATVRHEIERPSGTWDLHGISLVLTGRDEDAFNTAPFSFIAPVVRVCRYPRFTPAELDILLAHHRAPGSDKDHTPSSHPSPEARALHRFTGGQPLLAQLFLSRLDREATLDSMPAIYRQLRDTSHDSLAGWRRRLAKMITRDERIKNAVRDLAGGHEYRVGPSSIPDAAPMFTRSLSLAGWMSPGLSADGGTEVWRFSDLHKFWALQVLRSPERFLGGRGER